MKNVTALQLPDLSRSNEYPTDSDIVAALAGELMSACVRVSKGRIYAECEFNHLDYCVSCEVINSVISWTDPVISSVIGLANNSAAEHLADLIKRVDALGEVSSHA